jgi:hypothetical protein
VRGEAFTAFTSRLTRQGPYRYRYGRLRLHFPRHVVEEAQGEVVYFRYVQRAPDGTTLRLANCVIPRSRTALELARQRFTGQRRHPLPMWAWRDPLERSPAGTRPAN